MPELAARIRMLMTLSGTRSQEELSAWLLEQHNCEVSQGTLSNWMNGRVGRISPDKFYALNIVFQVFRVEGQGGDEPTLDQDILEFGHALGFRTEQVESLLRGDGGRGRGSSLTTGPLPFETVVTRGDELGALFRELKGVYLGHSYSLRNNGRITVSLLWVDELDEKRKLILCRDQSAGRFQYRGYLTLLKNDLIYCLLEESVHRNEMVQVYLTTCGTNRYHYLYGILSAISGERAGAIGSAKILYERLDSDVDNGKLLEQATEYFTSNPIDPAEIDSRVESIINNRLPPRYGDENHVLRADAERFCEFCDAVETEPPSHAWLETLSAD